MSAAKQSIQKKKGWGFSLIELLITVAVLGTLFAIGIPSFMTLREDNKLTSQTNELIGSIQFARSEAIKRARDISFSIANGSSLIEQGEELLSQESLNSDLVVIASENFTKGVVFSSNGFAYTETGALATGTISVCSTKITGSNTRVIALGAGGQTSVTQKNVPNCS